MVRVNGKARAVGWACLISGVVFGLLFASALARKIANGPSEANPIHDWPLSVYYAVMLAQLTLVLGVLWFLYTMAWHFGLGGVSLVMSRDGLFFPVLPRSKRGRVYRWCDLDSVERQTTENCPGSIRSIQRLNGWVSRDLLTLRMRFTRPVMPFGSWWRPIEWVYRLDGLTWKRSFPPDERAYVALEILVGAGVPPGVLFDCIRSLRDDAELRRQYVDTDATYEIKAADDGTWTLELADQ